MLVGPLAGIVQAGPLGGTIQTNRAGAQPVPTGSPAARIEMRVHSCPDDFDWTTG